MSSSSPPVFGKRNAPGVRAARRSPTADGAAPRPDHAAVFTAARQEIADRDERPGIVPRSFLAALLAGLVVGFGLAGLDVAQADAKLHQLAGITGLETTRLLPVMILFALVGGARAAATSLLIAHAVLRRIGTARHGAYALAGGLVAAAFVLAETALIHAGFLDGAMVPGHGLAVDTAAGAAAGFFYRVFAGSRPA